MELIKINERIRFYSPENEFLGDLNHAEFLYVRTEIIKNKLNDYYFIHYDENKTISKINNLGDIDCWSNSTFIKVEEYNKEILMLQNKNQFEHWKQKNLS